VKQDIEEENRKEDNMEEDNIEKKLDGMIPQDSQLNFNHFLQWFGKFKKSDLCLLLKRRAACIWPRNQDGAGLFFHEDGENIKL
jgi:hypothetical protein